MIMILFITSIFLFMLIYIIRIYHNNLCFPPKLNQHLLQLYIKYQFGGLIKNLFVVSRDL